MWFASVATLSLAAFKSESGLGLTTAPLKIAPICKHLPRSRSAHLTFFLELLPCARLLTLLLSLLYLSTHYPYAPFPSSPLLCRSPAFFLLYTQRD